MGGSNSLSEAAYKRLKHEIEIGNLQPGSRIREVEIANLLSVSRTPAREAIRRLESEGLVSFVPRYGAVISKLDHQATIELYDLREVLEGTAAGFAARHASVVEIEELEELIAAEPDIADSPNSLADLNRELHAALYRAAHNRFLERMLFGLRDSMTLLGGTSLRLEGRNESAHQEHLAIVSAISARDFKKAEEAGRKHIRNAQRARLKLMRESAIGGAE